MLKRSPFILFSTTTVLLCLSYCALAQNIDQTMTPAEQVQIAAPIEESALKFTSPTRHAAWAALFGNENSYISNTIPGYHLMTGGGIMGIEWQMCPHSQNWQKGIAIRYDYTDLNSREVLRTDQNFQSIRLIGYSNIQFNNPFYFSSMLSYAFNEYTSYRDTGAVIAQGDYDGRQFGAKLELGYEWDRCNVLVTPEISVYYSHLHVEPYTETNADVLNLSVPIQTAEALKWGFDLNLAYRNCFPRAQVIPYIHAKLEYDGMISPIQEFTASRVFGGGTAFITPAPDTTRTGYQLGAGIKVLGDHEVMIVMSYEYSVKSNYREHAALLSIQHDW